MNPLPAPRLRLILGPLAAAAAIVAATACARAADAGLAVTVTAHPLTPTDAPADEYFGFFKLSNLGVRNITHAFAVEGDSPLALPLERGRMRAVESALVDWGNRYPRDPWLRSAMFNYALVLEGKADPATSAVAVDLLLQASMRYQATPYARRADALLQSISCPTFIDLSVNTFDPPPLEMFELLPAAQQGTSK
ncbi:MAG TPA: hypothetical protein VEJ20_03540 [Candidatus Eremiobacteraceae bacterium]|nr:hypothetical protein [Candidatus Eremiobacteraceae bacterium]